MSLAANIRWIMILGGVLTCTMVYAAVLPHAALTSMFGESVEGPLAEMIVRNWGILITAVGLSLIYGAFNEGARRLALLLASGTKIGFAALVLSNSERYLNQQATIAAAFDLVLVALFVWYLLTARDAR